MKLHLEVSEAQREPNDLTGEIPIPLDQPTNVTIDAGEFVQVTYDQLRIAPHGDGFAFYDGDTGFWKVVGSYVPVLEVTTWEGQKVDPATVDIKGWLFTDFVVAER